jgi:hypothetical protein
VLPRVQKHVGERVPDLSRRTQHLQVEAFEQDRSAAAEGEIDGSSEPRPDRLHPGRERPGTAGLDDHVNVVGLDRIVDQAKIPAPAGHAEGPFELSNQSNRPE